LLVQFSNGNQIVHHYDAMGNRLRTTYYTRKVALVEPATNTIPGTDNPQEYNIVSYTMLGNKRYVRYNHGSWALEYVYNPEGYIKYWGEEEHYPYYYIKDHLGSVRETYINPYPNGKFSEQRMQYYPSGLPWNTNLSPSYQPFKYGGKEFVEMHGLDEYDSEARWYYPAIMRTTSMDPLCEKYYSTSPYAWCSNNPVNYVDPDGRDWYQDTITKYYTWFHGASEHENYIYIGPKGRLFGELESTIEKVLQDLKLGSLYTNGFTLDVTPTDKGALIASKQRDGDFFDEFCFNEGPEFSILLSDHPYTQQMMNDTKVEVGQNKVRDNKSFTVEPRKWTLWSVLNPYNWGMARQFIGSYTYYGESSTDGKYINNVIYDHKTRRFLFYHITPPSWNRRRSESVFLGTTYQLYIWQSLK